MVRRKGEQPVLHEPLLWSETCVIAGSIRTGSKWFYAWTFQQCVPLAKLSKFTGISMERLDVIRKEAAPTEMELRALAVPLRTDAASLAASIDFARSIKAERP